MKTFTHRTDRKGASVHSEQFGRGNKEKKRKSGKKGRERLSKTLCTVELGRKEEWEAIPDEEQGSQSRREIYVNRKYMDRKGFLLLSVKNRHSVPLTLNSQKDTQEEGKK